jgi:hypothetical protein
MPRFSDLIAALECARERYGDREAEVGAPPPPAVAPRKKALAVFPGGRALTFDLIPPLPTAHDRAVSAIRAEAAAKIAAVLPPGHRSFCLSGGHAVLSTRTAPRFTVAVYAGEGGGGRLAGSIPLPRGAVLLEARSATGFMVVPRQPPDPGVLSVVAGALMVLPPEARPPRPRGTLYVEALEDCTPVPEAAGGTSLGPCVEDSPIVATYEVWPEREVQRYLETPVYASVTADVGDNPRRAPVSRTRTLKFANWSEYVRHDPENVRRIFDASLGWYSRVGEVRIAPAAPPRNPSHAIAYRPAPARKATAAEAAPAGEPTASDSDDGTYREEMLAEVSAARAADGGDL